MKVSVQLVPTDKNIKPGSPVTEDLPALPKVGDSIPVGSGMNRKMYKVLGVDPTTTPPTVKVTG